MPSPPSTRLRVLLFGATGTIGQATCQALVAAGHETVCVLRPDGERARAREKERASIRHAQVTDPASLGLALHGERFDAVVSCLASRTGEPREAWAIDHQAHLNLLAAAQTAGARHFVLLSAICVQKPRLAFQHAKLAFEKALIESGMAYSIVRPTAYFKSLSGQLERLKQGKPFLMFGDGQLTACKPISDRDLGQYIATCLTDSSQHNRILPIGGPGDAITPRQQGEVLFQLLGKPPKFKQVPVAMLDAIAALLGATGKLIPALAAKAELARIGRYYATESMLVWNEAAQRYDAAATPSTGTDTLFDFYADVLAGRTQVHRGEHAVF